MDPCTFGKWTLTLQAPTFRCKVTGVTTTISFWHSTVMWQTPQRPQCVPSYTPVRSPVNKINLWKRRRKRQSSHKCWAYCCKTFKDCVDIDIHKCFMQPVGEEESSNDLGLQVKRPCRSRAPSRASHALGLLDRNVSSDSYSEEENWEEVNQAKLPPYFVYADYECTKKEQEHVPIPICAMGEDHISSLPPLHIYRRDCTEAFYNWLLT